MIKSYRGNGKKFYDIVGYGHEGRIEGMSRSELEELADEIDAFLMDDVDISETMAKFDMLMANFKCPEGSFNHGIKCGCKGGKNGQN